MKRLLFIAVIAFLTIHLCAQDIIVTIDAQKIEAKILEVSKSEIKYKEADNLDGPTFILSMEEISSIIYANGKVTLFDHATTNTNTVPPTKTSQVVSSSSISAVTPTEASTRVQTTASQNLSMDNTAKILLLNGKTLTVQIKKMTKNEVTYLQNNMEYTIPASEIQTVTFPNGQVRTYMETSTPQVPANTNVSTIQNEQKTIYSAAEFRGSILPRFSYEKVSVPGKKHKKRRFVGGNMVLDSEEFTKFLEMYCYEAYENYRKATTLSITSIVLDLLFLPAGIILCIVALNKSGKVLSTYNASCATKGVAFDYDDFQRDKVQLATIIPTSQTY